MKKVIFLMLFLMTFGVIAEEHVMVWSKKVDLYNDKGKVVKVLPYGRLVQAFPFPTDATRYLVKIDDVEYNARKSFFKPIGEVVNLYKKRVLELEAAIKTNDLKISNIESDLVVRYVQGLELERDTALSYMRITPVIGQNNQQQAFRSFSVLLTVGKFNRLKKEWNKEVEKLTKQKADLQAQNRKSTLDIAKIKGELKSFENLAQLFGNEDIDQVLYVTQNEARLFQKNKVVKVVKRGTILRGVPHPRFANWYDVTHEGDNYLISGKMVHSARNYYKKLEANKIQASLLITQINAEVEAQQFRLKLYQGISRQLEADKFIQGGYGLAKNLVVPIDKTHTFTIRSPVADEVYVNTARASRVLKNWKAESTALSKASLENQKKVLELKKSLVDLDAAIKELNRGAQQN